MNIIVKKYCIKKKIGIILHCNFSCILIDLFNSEFKFIVLGIAELWDQLQGGPYFLENFFFGLVGTIDTPKKHIGQLLYINQSSYGYM